MAIPQLWLILGVVAVVLAVVLVALAKQYRKVGPNEVLIVSGGRRRTVVSADGTKRKVGYRIHIGGGTLVLPFLESASTLPLETYTVPIRTPEVLTKHGVHIIAEAFAQVKVASDQSSIRLAAEQFLGRGAAAIREVTDYVIQGYVRSQLGALTVEEIYQNREEFARNVRSAAQSDLARMGLELLSFNLGDISDTQGYIAALGAPRIAQVKRDAAIAQAETEKDTTIKAALARKEGDVVRYQVEAEIAAAGRDFELKRADFQQEINGHKARADMAYEIERQKLAKELKSAEFETKKFEKDAAIAIEQSEIKRRELELESSVRKPAEARQYQIKLEAEAEKMRLALEAEGRADARLAEGRAEVEVKKAEGISRIEYTRNLGKAEAEAMRSKAEAYQTYNEAAVYQMFIEKLPDLARAVAEPLAKVDKIVMVGDGASGASQLTGQVAKVLGQLPEVVEAVSGIDLKEVLTKGKKKKGEE